MSKSRLLSFVVLLALLFTLGNTVFATNTSPAVTNGTAPLTTILTPLESTVAPVTSKLPVSSTILDPELTTTPETTGNTMMEDLETNGFRFTGLIIALAIAAAVIILVVLLVPKNKNKR